MDLYELRLDQPHPGTRDGDPGHGRVCQLPHPPRARAGRAPGAVAGTASRERQGSLSLRVDSQAEAWARYDIVLKRTTLQRCVSRAHS